MVVFATTDVPSSNSTVAETMTAPSGSVTVPRKLPPSAAKADDVNSQSNSEHQRMHLRKIRKVEHVLPPRVGEARPFS